MPFPKPSDGAPEELRYAILCGDSDVRIIKNPEHTFDAVQTYAAFLQQTFNAPTKIFVVKTEV